MNYEIFTNKTTAIFYNQHPQPIQRMLDFDWLCKRETPSIEAIVNPTGAGFHKCFFGNKEIVLPVYQTITQAAENHPKADVLVNFASARSAFETSMEALNTKSIRIVAITAEGIIENETRELIRIAKSHGKIINGPSTVGAIKAGAFRVGNTGGTIESLVDSKLYRPGSVSVITVSGGMTNEVFNIVAKNTDGVNEGFDVGGDRYTGSTMAENLLRFEANPNIRMHVLLGEIGGEDEYEIVKLLESGKVKKPLLAWIAGTVANTFKTEVQFGHAGARSGNNRGSAQSKNTALKKAGAHVPKSFNDFGKLIGKIFKEKVLTAKDYLAPADDTYNLPPLDFDQAVRTGLVRKPSSIITSISDERGEEATYNSKEIAFYADKPLGNTINALWFQGNLNKTGEEFIELCLKLTADHGPAVASAHNAIVTARSGKDIVDSLIAGLTTIGPRHGGAIDGAAQWIFGAVNTGLTARDVITNHKKRGAYILGIGHKIKTIQNPDKRVELLKRFARKNISSQPYLDFALAVETETLKKKNNLILNVDGAIAAIFLDLLKEAKFTNEQVLELLEIGIFNAIFVLGRSIGIIGHALDQKRLKQGLYRHNWEDIYYL